MICKQLSFEWRTHRLENRRWCYFGVSEVALIAAAATATAASDVAYIATDSSPSTPFGLYSPAVGGAVGAEAGGAFAGGAGEAGAEAGGAYGYGGPYGYVGSSGVSGPAAGAGADYLGGASAYYGGGTGGYGGGYMPAGLSAGVGGPYGGYGVSSGGPSFLGSSGGGYIGGPGANSYGRFGEPLYSAPQHAIAAAPHIGASPGISAPAAAAPEAEAPAAAIAPPPSPSTSIVSGSGDIPTTLGAGRAGGSILPGASAGGVVSPSAAGATAAQQIGAIGAGSPVEGGGAATDLGSVAGVSGASAIGASPGIDFATGSAAPAGDGALDAGITNAATQSSSPGLFAPGGLLGKGGDVSNFMQSPVGQIGNALAPTALAAIRGTPQVPQSISPLTQGGALTGPLIDTATSQLKAANSGQPTASQAAQLANFKQQAQQQLYQQLANEGVQNPTQDSRYVQGMAQIEQQSTALLQGFINSEFQNAFAAAGQASGNLTTAANAQLTQDQAFQQALDQAMQSFGLIMGGSQALQKAAA